MRIREVSFLEFARERKPTDLIFFATGTKKSIKKFRKELKGGENEIKNIRN